MSQEKQKILSPVINALFDAFSLHQINIFHIN